MQSILNWAKSKVERKWREQNFAAHLYLLQMLSYGISISSTLLNMHMLLQMRDQTKCYNNDLLKCCVYKSV